MTYRLWEKPVYIPTGRLATPNMLEFLKFKLEKKGVKVSTFKNSPVLEAHNNSKKAA